MATGTRKRLKVSPDKDYVAWQGASVDIDGVPMTVARGAKLRGDHPLVQRLGAAAFVPADTPLADRPTQYDEAIAQGAADDAERRKAAEAAAARRPWIDPKTPIGEVVVCIWGIEASPSGPLAEGSIVLKSDPRVRAVPGAFTPLLQRMVTG